MSVLARKALADVWHGRGRSLLVALAIALGIAAFASLLATYAVLTRELTRGYLATHPAAATIWTDEVDDPLLAALRAVPGVADVEARRELRGRMRVGPGEWRDLTLFVVRDFADIRISRLVPERGAWPPATGEILIERDALQVARAKIGDPVTVRLGSAEPRPLRLAGTVHDVGQAQARMEVSVYGYVTVATLAGLGERPILDQIKLAVAGKKLDRERARQVAEAVARRLAELGHPVARTEVPVPGEHPHAALMGTLLLAQASFGLFALFLSGVLVVNLMTARLAGEVRQIGVMKAVGGGSGQIARIYLGEALLLGIAALAIAVPLALAGERALCRAMATFLNFDVTSFAAPAWVWLTVTVAGLLVPLAAASLPVARGVSLPVRVAIADFGLRGTTFGASALERRLAGAGGGPLWLLLALRNPLRRRARTGLTVAAFAVGGVVFLSAANVRLSLARTIDRLFERQLFDVTVVLPEPAPIPGVERALASTPGLERWEAWLQTQATVASPAGAADATRAGGGGAPAGDRERTIRVLALPDGSSMLRPQLVAGRLLAPGDGPVLVANEALVASDARFAVGREVPVQMFHHTLALRVVGEVREALTGPTIYVPRSQIDAFAEYAGRTNSLRLAARDRSPTGVAALEGALGEVLEGAGLRPLATRSQAALRHGYDEHVVMIYVFLLAVAGIVLAVGGLGMATTTSLGVLERRREMGVMRALGATPARVAGLLVLEGVAIGVAAWALAVAAAWPVGLALGTLLARALFRGSFVFAFEPLAIAVWLVASVAVGALASWLPARAAARRPVREAIEYE